MAGEFGKKTGIQSITKLAAKLPFPSLSSSSNLALETGVAAEVLVIFRYNIHVTGVSAGEDKGCTKIMTEKFLNW